MYVHLPRIDTRHRQDQQKCHHPPPSDFDLVFVVFRLVNIINSRPQSHRASSINTFSRLVSLLMDLMQKT